MFRDEIFTDKNIAVHCDTKEKAAVLTEQANKRGLDWVSDIEGGNSCWLNHGKDTAYRLAADTHASVDYYKTMGIKVLSYEEALSPIPVTNRKTLIEVEGETPEWWSGRPVVCSVSDNDPWCPRQNYFFVVWIGGNHPFLVIGPGETDARDCKVLGGDGNTYTYAIPVQVEPEPIYIMRGDKKVLLTPEQVTGVQLEKLNGKVK